MNMYIACITAQDTNAHLDTFAPILFSAMTDLEARGKAMEICEEHFPPTEGFVRHSSTKPLNVNSQCIWYVRNFDV